MSNFQQKLQLTLDSVFEPTFKKSTDLFEYKYKLANINTDIDTSKIDTFTLRKIRKEVITKSKFINKSISISNNNNNNSNSNNQFLKTTMSNLDSPK